MPWASVQTSTNGTVTTNSTSWTLTYPTNIGNGDLLLLAMAIDGGAGITAGLTGWGTAGVTGGNVGLTLAAKKADGTETGTFSVTVGASEQGAWRMFRMTGYKWGGPSLGNSVTSGSVVSASTSGSSNSPDPPNCDPWFTDDRNLDILVFAIMAADSSRTISAYPSSPFGIFNASDVSGGANGATLGTSFALIQGTASDPGAFTISASDSWVAATVIVRNAYYDQGWGVQMTPL